MKKGGRILETGPLVDTGPRLTQILHIADKDVLGDALTGSTHDEALPVAKVSLHQLTQALTLFIIGDPSRHADLVATGNIDEETTWNGQRGRQAWPLTTQSLLANLHGELLTGAKDILDALLPARREVHPNRTDCHLWVLLPLVQTLTRHPHRRLSVRSLCGDPVQLLTFSPGNRCPPRQTDGVEGALGVDGWGLGAGTDLNTSVDDIPDVQESSTLKTQLDEGGLHARHNAHHPAPVDVADDAAITCSLDIERGGNPALNENGTKLPGCTAQQEGVIDG